METVSDYDNIPERDGVQAGCSNLDPTATEFSPKPNPGSKSAGIKPAVVSKKKPRSLPNKSTKHRSAKSSAQSKITSLFPKPRKPKVLSTHVEVENVAPECEDIGPEDGINDNMPSRPPCSLTVTSVSHVDVSQSPVNTSSKCDQDCNDDIPLNSGLFRVKYEQACKEISSLTAQNNILHSELDDKCKTIKSLQAENKRISNDSDNLRRQLSKHTGMRKFVDSSSAHEQALQAKDNEIAQLKATVSHYKIHMCEVASYIQEGMDVIPTPPSPRTYAEVVSDSTNSQSAKPTSTNPKPKRRKKRKQPKVISIGSSLTSGLGSKLIKRGLDATNFCYPGADIPRLRERIPHVISPDDEPDQVFLQGGGNDLHNNAPPHLVNIEIDNLISDVRRAAPNTQIILSKIPYRTYDPHLHGKIDCVNEYLDKRGRRGDNVFTVDVRPPFPYSYSKPEVIHFNRKGAQSYADKVASQLINFQSDLLINQE